MHKKTPKSSTFPRPFLVVVLLLSMATLVTLSLLLLLSHPPSSAASFRHHLPAAAGSGSPPPHLLQACAATRFPTLCLTTLTSSPSLPPSPTPTDLILAALSAASSSLPTATSLAQSILSSSSSNPSRSSAARNCLSHISLSSRRLSAASSSLPSSRALAGAALLYQYDCWSALKYVNSTHQVSSAMSFLSSLSSLTSNALSMLAALYRFGPDLSLWAPPQTERDGYWGDGPAASVATVRTTLGAIPFNLSPDTNVCKTSGECVHQTVQSAVDAAPEYGSARFVIYIKAGVYEETVRVPFEKTNLVFLGDGIGKTVITASLNAQMEGISTYNTATVGVAGDGFMARGLTFENAAGTGAHQAVAFMSDSDLSILELVEFSGHQDTLWARSMRQLYRSCRISGTVDFIFGNSATVFENCTVLVVPRLGSPMKGETNALTAQGRTDPAQATGFVFHNCTIDGRDDYLELYRARPGRHKVYLGRPWKEFSRVVFIDCYLGEIVRPEGWLPWRGDFALGTLFYGEFGSLGPGANATTRVEWSSQIPVEHVGSYSMQNFIQGDEWIPSNQ